MKVKGPIITLAAGVALAAVLMVVNLSVTKKSNNNAEVGNPAAAAATTSAAATVAPSASATAPPVAVGTQDTYAGNVNGGGATIAIAVKDGKAVAYLCDGKTGEAWMQGTLTAGKLSLSGEKNSTLTGTVANGTASGDIKAAGRQFTFAVKTVAPPSGLYRATATVRNAKIVGGWIVLPDGTQTGLASVDSATVVPGPINLTTGTASVGSDTVTASKLDGSPL